MGNRKNCLGKVAIVGTGFVGSTAAYTIMLDGIANHIVLIDKDKDKAEGHALDLMHGMQFTKSTHIEAGDSLELVHDAQIVVLTAGFAQKPGESRAALLEKNVNIFRDLIPQIVKYNKDCILLVVTNPVDVLTYVAYKLSGFDSCKVFGTGTVLDTARLRYLLGEKLEISPKDITAYILGEHGDSQFVWWSHANIAGVPISKIPICAQNFCEQLHQKVKNAVYEVIEKKGATYYAIALVIAKIVRAILLDQSRVFTVSTVLKNYYENKNNEIKNICLSIPTVIRKGGICQQFEIYLNKEEEAMFDLCLKRIYKDIKEAEEIGF
ncbi:MAG: L-lactate dehydrogenase [Candidatus Babeliales bacterium]